MNNTYHPEDRQHNQCDFWCGEERPGMRALKQPGGLQEISRGSSERSERLPPEPNPTNISTPERVPEIALSKRVHWQRSAAAGAGGGGAQSSTPVAYDSPPPRKSAVPLPLRKSHATPRGLSTATLHASVWDDTRNEIATPKTLLLLAP